MNAWKPLLEVQALDTTLTQLAHRRDQLPERAELAQVEEELGRLRTTVESAEADKHALVKDQKRIEDEIALLEDKIAGAEKVLYGGGSSDPKELQAFQDEITSLRDRISRLEDDELELMEQVEPIDEALAGHAETKTALDAQAQRLTATIAEAEAALDRERDDVAGRRSELVAAVPADVVAEYDALRARLGGVAVARLDGGVCGACHLKLSAVEHDRILHLSPDERVVCEDCGRVLVRD